MASKMEVGDITKISGEVNIAAGNIVKNIRTIYQRSVTAAEEAAKARSWENKLLAEGVSSYLKRIQQQAKHREEERSPYKGLLQYRLADAEAFFGRSAAIHDLLTVMDRGPLTILQAESGAGKTSLLQAGIMPRILAHGHLPVLLRPYNRLPSEALKKTFLPDLGQSPVLKKAPLRDVLSRVSNILGSKASLFVLIDQFEEFFNHIDGKEQNAFITDLGECLDDGSLDVHWMLSLRTEYHGRLGNFQPRISQVYENDYLLKRLTGDEAREAVIEPAKRHRIKFEKGLPERIIGDLRNDKNEIDPPQLQLVCLALFEALPPEERIISQQSYEKQGSAKGILGAHLERVLKRLPSAQRSAALQVLEELITSVQQRVVKPRDRLVESLSGSTVNIKAINSVINQLVESRLVRVEESDEGVTYELAHDYLLNEIKLAPEIKLKKEADEVLEQGLNTWRKLHKHPFSSDTLAVIKRERQKINFNAESAALILLNAASTGHLDEWVGYFSGGLRKDAIQYILSLSAEKDRKGSGYAGEVLWSLRRELPEATRGAFIPQYFLRRKLPVYSLWGSVTFIILLTVFKLLSLYTVLNTDGWKLINNYATSCPSLDQGSAPAISADPFQPRKIYLYDPGKNELICTSSDSGATWEAQTLPIDHSVRQLAAANDELVIITSESLYKGTSSTLDEFRPPKELEGTTIQDIAVNPERKGEYFLLTEDGRIYRYISDQWEQVETFDLDNTPLSIATDGRYLTVLTQKYVWSLLMEQPGWSGIALPDGLVPDSIAMPQQGLGQFYVTTSDNRIFTGVAQKTDRLIEVKAWPQAASLEFSENATFLGGANGIYCQGHWNIFTREWWSIISKNYPPCY